eukprot:1304154-Rhodomonas_salina.1
MGRCTQAYHRGTDVLYRTTAVLTCCTGVLYGAVHTGVRPRAHGVRRLLLCRQRQLRQARRRGHVPPPFLRRDRET